MAVEFVDAERIAELNRAHRGKDGPDRRALVPGRRGRRSVRAARAGRRRDLPRAHRGSARGGRARRAAPDRHGPRDRRGRDARACRRRSWRGCDEHPLGVRGARRAARTSASRRWSTRWSATRSRSSPTSRRPRGARSAASSRVPGPLPARADRPAGRPAPARRAHASACSGAWSPSWRSPTRRCSCVNGEQGVGGPGDRFIAEALAGREGPGRDRGQQGRPRSAATRPSPRCRPPPTSGLRRRGVPDLRPHRPRACGALVDHLAGLLPEGPFYFPPEEVSDQPERRHARRAGARAGAAPHPPGGPARGRGPDRGDRASATAWSPCARSCGRRPSPRRAS